MGLRLDANSCRVSTVMVANRHTGFCTHFGASTSLLIGAANADPRSGRRTKIQDVTYQDARDGRCCFGPRVALATWDAQS